METEGRSVLGRVSSSRLNAQRSPPTTAKTASRARMSLGPGTMVPRYSLGGMMTAKKKNKRMSMMPMGTSSTRRQSIMSTASGIRRKSVAPGSTGVLKNDPRPINDKAFMRSMIEDLIQFLVEHNYDQSISPKILHRPTGKDFENMIHFLFNLLDPHRQPSDKFADDVTVMFKGLKYPFNISKTSLAAVGSMHTWPTLLASLVWIVELLQYDELAGSGALGYEEIPMEELDSEKQFFVYLKRAYAFFLAGDDTRQDQLDEERKSFIIQDQEAVKQEVEQVAATKAALERQLEEESAAKSIIPELEQKKRDFQSDKLKWEKLIRQFEENKEIMLSKVNERQAECAEKEEELENAKHQKEKVQIILDEQELSPADAERMNQEKSSLEEAKNKVLENRDEIQKDVWDLEMAISKREQKINSTVEQYNQTAKSLRLVQQGGEQGSSLVLRFDHVAGCIACVGTDGTSMSKVDAAAITSSLEDLQELSYNKIHQIRTEAMELQVKVDENEEEKSVLLGEIKVLEQRLESINEQYQEHKQDLERELSIRAADMEHVEEEIHHLKMDANTLEAPLQDLQLKQRALETELEQLRAANQEELEIIDEEVNKALELCCAFQEQTSSILRTHEESLRVKETYVKELCTSRLGDLRSLVGDISNGN